MLDQTMMKSMHTPPKCALPPYSSNKKEIRGNNELLLTTSSSSLFESIWATWLCTWWPASPVHPAMTDDGVLFALIWSAFNHFTNCICKETISSVHFYLTLNRCSHSFLKSDATFFSVILLGKAIMISPRCPDVENVFAFHAELDSF